MNNGSETELRTVSSIANGTSRLNFGVRPLSAKQHLWRVCAREGKRSNFDVIWAESVMVQWQCFVPVWGGGSSRAGKWEWRNDKWQATQITFSWFGRIGGPRLDGLLCQAPSPRRFCCLFCLSKHGTKSLNKFRKFSDTLHSTCIYAIYINTPLMM